jgi:hypothetical protein
MNCHRSLTRRSAADIRRRRGADRTSPAPRSVSPDPGLPTSVRGRDSTQHIAAAWGATRLPKLLPAENLVELIDKTVRLSFIGGAQAATGTMRQHCRPWHAGMRSRRGWNPAFRRPSASAPLRPARSRTERMPSRTHSWQGLRTLETGQAAAERERPGGCPVAPVSTWC